MTRQLIDSEEKSAQDDSFMARWSARKTAARSGELEEASAPDMAPGVSVDTPPEPELTEQEALEKFDLKDPDDLSQGDDFKGFLQNGVPEALKRRALRRLWRLNPVLANVDGLVDYGDDFTDKALAVKVLETSYKIGRGFGKRLSDPPEIAPKEEPQTAEFDAAQEPHPSAKEPKMQTDADDLQPNADSLQPDADALQTGSAPQNDALEFESTQELRGNLTAPEFGGEDDIIPTESLRHGSHTPLRPKRRMQFVFQND